LTEKSFKIKYDLEDMDEEIKIFSWIHKSEWTCGKRRKSLSLFKERTLPWWV